MKKETICFDCPVDGKVEIVITPKRKAKFGNRLRIDIWINKDGVLELHFPLITALTCGGKPAVYYIQLPANCSGEIVLS